MRKPLVINTIKWNLDCGGVPVTLAAGKVEL
jgi:hypothetical protein